MDMNEQVISQIKKYIADMKSDTRMNDLHKGAYVRGYMSALDDIKRIVDLGDSLHQTPSEANKELDQALKETE